MKINIKNIIRLIILLPLSIYLLYSVYYFITNDIKPTYIDCGIVKSKSYDDVVIKYGTKTELYLNVQFEKTGFKSIKCSPTVYFSKNIGDNICLELNKDTTFQHKIISISGLLVLFILGNILIGIIIRYIIPDHCRI